jgi:hypothetical protein
MLEKHYSKLKPYMKLATLNGSEDIVNKSYGILENGAYTRLELLLMHQQQLIDEQTEAIKKLLDRLQSMY